MSDADAVHRRRRNNRLLHSRLNLLNRSVTLPLRNANSDASNRSNDASRLNSVESSAVRRKLNVLRSQCDNNSRRVNVSQHQHDSHNNNGV